LGEAGGSGQGVHFLFALALVNCSNELLQQAVQREPTFYKALVGSNTISPPKSRGNESKMDIISIPLGYY
jgi:hypothetical protein